MKAIESIDDSYPSYSLVVTGHSLGAAIATIAAAQLRNEGHPAALVSIKLTGSWVVLIPFSIPTGLPELGS